MKVKVKLFLFTLFIFLSGCSENISRNYVKNIYINKDENKYILKLEYYDFSGNRENYITSEYSDEDIFTLGIKATEDKDYNFRLCENICIGPELLISDSDKIFYTITGLKVSPNSNICCLLGESIKKGDEIFSPLYNLSERSGSYSGTLPLVSANGNIAGAVIVKDGNTIKVADKKTMSLISILNNEIENTDYTFRDGQMWARLNCDKTFFEIKNNILYININLTLKEYKGIHNSINAKDLFINLLKADIGNNVYDIYQDIQLTQFYNLYWYEKQKGIECSKVEVEVSIK